MQAHEYVRMFVQAMPCPPSHRVSVFVHDDMDGRSVQFDHGDHQWRLPLEGIIFRADVDVWGSIVMSARTWVDGVHREDMMQSDWPVF